MISNGMRMSKGLSKWNKGNISQCPNGNIDTQRYKLTYTYWKIWNVNLCLFSAKYKMLAALLCAIVLGLSLGLIFGLKKKNGGL